MLLLLFCCCLLFNFKIIIFTKIQLLKFWVKIQSGIKWEHDSSVKIVFTTNTSKLNRY
jgi:hypothetical protein